QHPARERAQLPRRRGATAHPELGEHDPGRHGLLWRRVVDVAVPGTGDPDHGGELQHGRRGGARRARSRAASRRVVIAHLLRRVAWSILVLVLVATTPFGIFFAIPTNRAALIAGKYASPQTIAMIEKKLGLDQPKPIQLLRFLSRAARGDLGDSYASQQPVA